MSLKRSEEQARLVEALHKRNTQFSALNRLSGIISQSASLEEGLKSTLDQLLEITQADIGSIHIIEPNTGILKLAASRGLSHNFTCTEERIPIGDCLCGEAAGTGGPVSSMDLSKEPRLSREACRDEGFNSMMSIPLKSREQVLGTLGIYAKRLHAFSEMDQELLTLVGSQMGVAIENAQLYAQTREMAVMKERGLIAQEIHDGIAQSLAYLNLETKKLEGLLKEDSRKAAMNELSQIREVIQGTYEDVRELLVDFRIKFKGDEDIVEAISNFARDFSQRTGIRVRINRSDGALKMASTDQVLLFRIVQEAFSNIRKHASASEITLCLSGTSTQVNVTVQDDGLGFDPEVLEGKDPDHMGLEIMRERISHLHGHLKLDSKPGRGTTLLISVPLKTAEG